MNRVIRSGAERNQKGTNGQSPQRQLGESSGPTYQESTFNLESALYAARRKRSAAGSDPTAFSLFANPTSLDFFQALPVTT